MQGTPISRDGLANTISVVIPAYNEALRLEPTVREVAAYLRGRAIDFEIIVVDDGSRDGTFDIVQRLGAEIREVRGIRLPANRGKGCAVRTGVLAAHGARVLFTDADGATPIAELARLEGALDDGADGAIGSRAGMAHGVQIEARLHRRLLGRVFHTLVCLVAVGGYHDTQCGFKLFSRAVANDLFSRQRSDGFSFDVELLMLARRLGYRIREVPVNWTHQPGSRINLVTDSARMALDLFVIRARLLRSRRQLRNSAAARAERGARRSGAAALP